MGDRENAGLCKGLLQVLSRVTIRVSPLRKCPQPRRESFKKILVRSLVLTQDKQLYSILPDRTTPNSWVIGKNIEKTLVTVLVISSSRLTYLKNQERMIQRDQTIYKSLECTPDKTQEDS